MREEIFSGLFPRGFKGPPVPDLVGALSPAMS